MRAGRFRSAARVGARLLLPTVLGMLAGGAFNAALGGQGADTPALALLGGGVALGVAFAVRARRRVRAAGYD